MTLACEFDSHLSHIWCQHILFVCVCFSWRLLGWSARRENHIRRLVRQVVVQTHNNSDPSLVPVWFFYGFLQLLINFFIYLRSSLVLLLYISFFILLLISPSFSNFPKFKFSENVQLFKTCLECQILFRFIRKIFYNFKICSTFSLDFQS